MSDSDSHKQSSIGSPPLILACLAIGVFSAALISVFGWRRVRFANDVGHSGSDGRVVFGRHGLDSWGNLRERPGMSEKPIMWEVWTDRNARVNDIDYGCWHHVMPLALYSSPPEFSSNHESATEADSPSTFSASLPSTAGRRRPFRGFTASSLFPLRRQTATLDPLVLTDAAEDGREGEAEAAAKKQTQVVILVELPSLVSSRRRNDHALFGRSEYYSAFSKSETLVETHDKMREELLGSDFGEGERQYCIGVHNCPLPVSTKLKDDKEASRASRTMPKS